MQIMIMRESPSTQQPFNCINESLVPFGISGQEDVETLQEVDAVDDDLGVVVENNLRSVGRLDFGEDRVEELAPVKVGKVPGDLSEGNFCVEFGDVVSLIVGHRYLQ